jgi:hypothetical protein
MHVHRRIERARQRRVTAKCLCGRRRASDCKCCVNRPSQCVPVSRSRLALGRRNHRLGPMVWPVWRDGARVSISPAISACDRREIARRTTKSIQIDRASNAGPQGAMMELPEQQAGFADRWRQEGTAHPQGFDPEISVEINLMRRDIDDWSLAIMGFTRFMKASISPGMSATDCPGGHGPYAPHPRRAAAPRLLPHGADEVRGLVRTGHALRQKMVSAPSMPAAFALDEFS